MSTLQVRATDTQIFLSKDGDPILTDDYLQNLGIDLDTTQTCSGRCCNLLSSRSHLLTLQKTRYLVPTSALGSYIARLTFSLGTEDRSERVSKAAYEGFRKFALTQKTQFVLQYLPKLREFARNGMPITTNMFDLYFKELALSKRQIPMQGVDYESVDFWQRTFTTKFAQN